MTENEIIKALKQCSTGKCIGCPCIGGDTNCLGVLTGNALDMIKRKDAEIEMLKSDLKLKNNDYEHLLMKCKELQGINKSRKDRLIQMAAELQKHKKEFETEGGEKDET